MRSPRQKMGKLLSVFLLGLKSGRMSLFIAALAPMFIWVLSNGVLARPFETFVWSIVCAIFASCPPGKVARWSALAQTLMLPISLLWVGTVALTGSGPSPILFYAAATASISEILTSSQMALHSLAFIGTAFLCISSCIWAIYSTRKKLEDGNILGTFFLCALLLLGVANVAAIPILIGISGPEARSAVSWLSCLNNSKVVLMNLVNDATLGKDWRVPVRSVASAPKTFIAINELSVFVLGESLRADALIDEHRGPYSIAIINRLNSGLGVRLQDACAAANATYLSTPRILTAVEPTDSAGAEKNPTILALAKAAGANTAYISNHEQPVVVETGHDVSVFTTSMERNSFDDMAIEAFDNFVKKFSHGPRAVLLHLYGQHFKYRDRYPDGFFGTEPLDISADDLEELRYQRAAEYGLKILLDASKILDGQSEPAFLVFTSDHGENLPSDNTGKKLHAGPTSGKNDTTVPVLVLWNKAFAESGRSKMLENLVVAKNIISHQDVAKAWLVLAGLPETIDSTKKPRIWTGEFCSELNR